MPKHKKMPGYYRGVLVPISEDMLVRIATTLGNHQHENHHYTCHEVQYRGGDVDAWGRFLEDLGIDIGGGGFCTPTNSDPMVEGDVHAPAWLVRKCPYSTTRNELRYVLLTDILKEAFNHDA